MGAPELADHPDFSSYAVRLEHREELSRRLGELSRRRTTAEWLARLAGEVPCGPVNSVPEALADPQVSASDLIWEVDHPELGVVRTVGSPVRVSDYAPARKRGPALGEDTDRVLAELAGFSTFEIDALRGQRVV